MRSLLLIALLACLVLAACGDDDSGGDTADRSVPSSVAETETETQPETTATTASTETAAATTTASPTPTPRQLESFRSPSGNIACIGIDAEVRCDVRAKTWSPPPRPADCQLDYGQGLSITAGDEPRIVCAGDTTLNPNAPVLAYGEANKTGLITCKSAQAGITCIDDETGRGFFISRDSYKLI
ncbi:MAG TPA: DUF6636 domain-containing protein [Baekduia sp.]|nr:DUF6636 domain-containing protein [Baekduia sp.]